MIKDFTVSLPGAAALLTLVVCTVVFQVGLERASNFASSRANDHYMMLFNSLVREFCVFGVMSFLLFFIENFLTLRAEHLTVLHAAHAMLLGLALLFVLQSLYLMANLERAIGAIDKKNAHAYRKLKDDIWLASTGSRAQAAVVEAANFCLVRELFIAIHGLPKSFDYAGYLARRMCSYAVQTIDISPMAWLVSVVFFAGVLMGLLKLGAWHTMLVFSLLGFVLLGFELLLYRRVLGIRTHTLSIMGVIDPRNVDDVAAALQQMPERVRDLRVAFAANLGRSQQAGRAHRAYDCLHAAMRVAQCDEDNAEMLLVAGGNGGDSGSDAAPSLKTAADAAASAASRRIGSEQMGHFLDDALCEVADSSGSNHRPPSRSSSISDLRKAEAVMREEGEEPKKESSRWQRMSKAAAKVARSSMTATAEQGGKIASAALCVVDANRRAHARQQLFPDATRLHEQFTILLLLNNMYISLWAVNLLSFDDAALPCAKGTLDALTCVALVPCAIGFLVLRPRMVALHYFMMSTVHPSFQCIAECAEQQEDVRVVQTLVGLAIRQQFPRGEGALLACFEAWDADGNGTLSATEIRVGMESMGVHLSKTRFKMLMRKIDANKDGMIAYHEFLDSLYQQEHTVDRMMGAVAAMYGKGDAPLSPVSGSAGDAGEAVLGNLPPMALGGKLKASGVVVAAHKIQV
jgi:hypothetical protein